VAGQGTAASAGLLIEGRKEDRDAVAGITSPDKWQPCAGAAMGVVVQQQLDHTQAPGRVQKCAVQQSHTTALPAPPSLPPTCASASSSASAARSLAVAGTRLYCSPPEAADWERVRTPPPRSSLLPRTCTNTSTQLGRWSQVSCLPWLSAWLVLTDLADSSCTRCHAGATQCLGCAHPSLPPSWLAHLQLCQPGMPRLEQCPQCSGRHS
jgi:hypothetical protein